MNRDLSAKLLVGGAGGVTPLIGGLALLDAQAIATYLQGLSNPGGSALLLLIGYIIKGIFMFGVGAFWAYLHRSEKSTLKLYQLGIVAPAVISGLIYANEAKNTRNAAGTAIPAAELIPSAHGATPAAGSDTFRLFEEGSSAASKILSGILGRPLSVSDLPAQSKKTIVAIRNIFETGKIQPAFSDVVYIHSPFPADLEYGMSLASLRVGNLYRIVKAYTDKPGAQFRNEFEPYLDRLLNADPSLSEDASFRGLLARAASDPYMKEAQGEFFIKTVWRPAVSVADSLGITTPLGMAVLLSDGWFSGQWTILRQRTDAQIGPLKTVGERVWISSYVARGKSLTSSNPILQRDAHRLDAFQRLIDAGNWDLALPVTVWDRTINASDLESW